MRRRPLLSSRALVPRRGHRGLFASGGVPRRPCRSVDGARRGGVARHERGRSPARDGRRGAQHGGRDRTGWSHRRRALPRWLRRRARDGDVGVQSIVAIAAGLAINDGKLALDTPVAALAPEWHDDGKRAITVRHLLSQTSGLEHIAGAVPRRRDDRRALGRRPRRVRAGESLAIQQRWRRSARGGEIERAVGEPFDRYVERALFAKLDIRGASWLKDRAGHGAWCRRAS